MNKIRLLTFGLLAITPFAFAQTRDFPNRPIRLIAPFGPGSAADTACRFFGDQLARILAQPIIVENRAGASGSVGALAVKNAPADGYTMLHAAWSAQSVNPIVIRDLPYDPIRDFRPITGLMRSAMGFFVPASSKMNTLADLVATAKKDPQLLNVGNISAGQLIIGQWFASLAGVKFMNVPYKNGSQMLTDLIGNRLALVIESVSVDGPMVKSGKLRILAVAGENRSAEFPGVPTVKESGYPDFVSYGWGAWYVRSETPDDVANILTDAMQKVLATDTSREFARKIGSELMPFAPVALRRLETNELATFQRVADAAGIKAEKTE